MEIIRHKFDVWGEEVILGVSWDLLWVVVVAILVLLAGHAIVMAALAKKKAKPSPERDSIQTLVAVREGPRPGETTPPTVKTDRPTTCPDAGVRVGPTRAMAWIGRPAWSPLGSIASAFVPSRRP